VISTRARLALATFGVAGAGVVGATTSTAAVPICVGDTHAAVCVTVDPNGLPVVDPTGGPGIHDCVYAGPPPCKPVDLPSPSVTPGSGSYLVLVQCGGDAIICDPIVVKLPPPLVR